MNSDNADIPIQKQGHEKAPYQPPRAEVFAYAAEQGYSSSETGSGFVNNGIPDEVINLKLMLNNDPTNRNDQYQEINWSGFGESDDFWSGGGE